MSWIFSLYVALLFFVLTPAILVRLPPKGGKFTVAAFHAVVFALVLHFTGKMVWRFSRGLEGFQEGNTATCVENPEKGELNTPFTAQGKQNCITNNKNYCDNLVHGGNPTGYYTYDKSKEKTKCITNPNYKPKKK
jgi:hypothetical protein